jgi:hypothetical protein
VDIGTDDDTVAIFYLDTILDVGTVDATGQERTLIADNWVVGE